MKNGMIGLGTPEGMEFGFTSDLFDGWLWKDGKYIWISMIISKHEGKGNLRRLFEKIQKKGFGIKVPTPFARMTAILKKNGFEQSFQRVEPLEDELEVWTKEPPTRKKEGMGCNKQTGRKQ